MSGGDTLYEIHHITRWKPGMEKQYLLRGYSSRSLWNTSTYEAERFFGEGGTVHTIQCLKAEDNTYTYAAEKKIYPQRKSKPRAAQKEPVAITKSTDPTRARAKDQQYCRFLNTARPEVSVKRFGLHYYVYIQHPDDDTLRMLDRRCARFFRKLNAERLASSVRTQINTAIYMACATDTGEGGAEIQPKGE